jgi:Pyruvate/2-oxoacid:ferredoxin oxidoreductase gamma subunit
VFYHEITVWTRGIIMDKEARDVANSLAQAAKLEGRYTQFISDYVDAPDRTNCLIRKYARISDEDIKFKFIYENAHPDIVVLVEETLVKAVNFTRNTPPGEGVVVVNTHRDADYIWRFLPDHSKVKKLVCIDATSLASESWIYEESLYDLSQDRMSTEGSAERKQIGIGVAAPLIGAVAAATGIVKMESLEKVVGDYEAVKRGAAGLVVKENPAPVAVPA